MIKEATPLEASEMGDVVIENDEATLKLFNDKLKQAGVIRELKEASPNLSDIQLESISKLQVELNNLNGNNTEVASNRKKGLKNKIKEIESQKDTEPTFTKDDANVYTGPTDDKYATINRGDEKGNVNLTKEEFDALDEAPAEQNDPQTVEEVVQEKVVEEVEAEDVDKATKEVNDYIDEISIAAEESVFGNKNIVDETLDKINKAEYVNDDEIDNGIDALFDEIERVNSLSISDQAKKNITDKLYNIAETLDNYEFRTKTETRQTTERKTTKVPIQSAAGKRTPEQFFDKTTARVNGKIVKLFTKTEGLKQKQKTER